MRDPMMNAWAKMNHRKYTREPRFIARHALATAVMSMAEADRIKSNANAAMRMYDKALQKILPISLQRDDDLHTDFITIRADYRISRESMVMYSRIRHALGGRRAIAKEAAWSLAGRLVDEIDRCYEQATGMPS